jgi:hypothetical protein
MAPKVVVKVGQKTVRRGTSCKQVPAWSVESNKRSLQRRHVVRELNVLAAEASLKTIPVKSEAKRVERLIKTVQHQTRRLDAWPPGPARPPGRPPACPPSRSAVRPLSHPAARPPGLPAARPLGCTAARPSSGRPAARPPDRSSVWQHGRPVVRQPGRSVARPPGRRAAARAPPALALLHNVFHHFSAVTPAPHAPSRFAPSRLALLPNDL